MKRTLTIVLCIITLYTCKQDTDFKTYNNPIVWDSSKATTNSVYDGIEYVIKAFERFDIVAIGESHGIKEVTDFYMELVKNENFRKKVDVIVFEIGNSLYQEDLDNYILGNSNDAQKIKMLWRDHTSSILQNGDRTSVSKFFSEVRNTNFTTDHKLRILAADPPIEWAKLHNSKDFFEFLDQRDMFYTDLVLSEVLKKNKKALLIMGNRHFNKCKPHQNAPDNPISAIIRSTNKNLVLINTMTSNEFPYDQLHNIKKGQVIETVNPVVGDLKIGTPFLNDHPLKVQSDALLYLGEMKKLNFEEQTPFNDLVYENELNRRKELINIKQSQ